jgi:hypothetical protein
VRAAAALLPVGALPSEGSGLHSKRSSGTGNDDHVASDPSFCTPAMLQQQVLQAPQQQQVLK